MVPGRLRGIARSPLQGQCQVYSPLAGQCRQCQVNSLARLCWVSARFTRSLVSVRPVPGLLRFIRSFPILFFYKPRLSKDGASRLRAYIHPQNGGPHNMGPEKKDPLRVTLVNVKRDMKSQTARLSKENCAMLQSMTTKLLNSEGSNGARSPL